MKNIAYKLTQNDPHYPDGFAKDFIETDQDTLEGYVVAPRSDLHDILLNNKKLVQEHDPAKVLKPAGPAEPVTIENTLSNDGDAKLFQEFLAWKASQGNNS